MSSVMPSLYVTLALRARAPVASVWHPRKLQFVPPEAMVAGCDGPVAEGWDVVLVVVAGDEVDVEA